MAKRTAIGHLNRTDRKENTTDVLVYENVQMG